MHRPSSRGYTLIELLLVIVILGISMSLIVVNLARDNGTRLEEDARHVALLLQHAQEEALLGGRALAWTATAEGYGFSRRERGRNWVPVVGPDPLAARKWSAGALVSRVSVAGAPLALGEPLVFLPSGVNLPYEVRLSAGEWRISVAGDAAGRVRVSRADRLEVASR
ncbi:MAG TPA: GspH/FimT family pseudopilin [Burkholderiales bacterium]|nr:GspH/FimT family pseudopilin [Burkholderiales bacterium]